MKKREPTLSAGAPPPEAARDPTLELLLSVVEDLTVERDEEGLLRTTLEHVVGFLDATGGVSFLLQAEEELTAAAESGLNERDRGAARELARTALQQGGALVRETLDGGWFAVAPFVSGQRPLGVLVLRREGGGSVPHAHILEALGRQIGTGLANVRMYAELRESASRVEVLNRLTTSLTGGMDLTTVLPDFAREVASVEAFDRLAVAFVNDSGDYLEVVGHPPETTWGLGSAIPVVGSGPGSVVLNSRPILVADLIESHQFIEDMRLLEEGVRSYALLPLNARGRTIGVLALGSSESGRYGETVLTGLQPLVDSVALALENVRLFQRTRELSITDELTPLYNSRFFRQILEREIKLVDRYESVLSLIFVDLDEFKPINDRYGHLRGSRVLREVGFLLRAAVRETDYPARYGGDEFVVILPQTDGAAAVLLAEKLRSLIEEHVFLQEEGINARVGASFGVATYPSDARSKEALIRLADERMYADKSHRSKR